ncbi:MAG TPA: polymer-forming cytoskeletal protein [Tepidiformaceae bacterium]
MLKKNPRESQYPEGDAFEETNIQHTPEMAVGRDDEVRTPWRREPLQSPAEQKPGPVAEAGGLGIESVIDAHSSFDGKYETQKDLRIFGSITGEVICRGQLTVERDAVAKARVQAHDVAVRGRVEGELSCTGKLTIESSAVVSATIRTATLVVQEGATVSGNVETSGAEAAPPVVPASRSRRETPAPEEEAAGNGRAGRARDLPSFALVSSDERAGNSASAR